MMVRFRGQPGVEDSLRHSASLISEDDVLMQDRTIQTFQSRHVSQQLPAALPGQGDGK